MNFVYCWKRLARDQSLLLRRERDVFLSLKKIPDARIKVKERKKRVPKQGLQKPCFRKA